MQPSGIALLLWLWLALSGSAACAQKESGTNPQAAPSGNPAKEVKPDFDRSGILKLQGRAGKHMIGVVGILFSVYEQPHGGAPLWQEVQNVELDKQGYFRALVGSTKSEGIPTELFTQKKMLWLGKQVLLPGQVEQPRIRIESTGDGLMIEDAPEKSGGDQLTAAETQKSQQDRNGPTNKSLRGRLHRR